MKRQSDNIRTELLQDMAAWRALAPSWDRLLARSAADTIFLTQDWLSSWLEEFSAQNRTLFVIAVLRGDELIGAAPWMLRSVSAAGRRTRQIESMGLPESGADYLDIISLRGWEGTVARAIYDFLFQGSTNTWDTACLRDIPADSLTLMHFLEHVRRDGKYVSITEGSYCPGMRLPQTSEDLFSGLTPNRRQQWRRHLRLLEKQGEVAFASSFGADAGKAAATFFSLYRKNYALHGLERFLGRFSRTERGASSIQVDLLTVKQVPVAGLYHLAHHDTQHMYLMAVDKTVNQKVSLGNILLGFALQEAISQGRKAYDFLKGTEEYKFHWSDGGRRALDLFFCRKSAASLVPVIGKSVKDIARVLIR